MITEQWKDWRIEKDFSVIIAKTTSYYSFPWQIGFHRVPSNTNCNSYKSNPFIFSTKKKKTEGQRGRKNVNFNIFKGSSMGSMQSNKKEEKFFSELILEIRALLDEGTRMPIAGFSSPPCKPLLKRIFGMVSSIPYWQSCI